MDIASLNNEVYISEGISFNSYELGLIHRNIILESDMIDISLCNIHESYNGYTTLLTEAESNFKANMVKLFEKLKGLIQGFTNKFTSIARELIAKNKAWINQIKNDKFLERVPATFKYYNTYPYWNGINKAIKYKFPDFQESNSEFISELEDINSFKEKYLKDLFIDKNGKPSFDPLAVFRGGDSRVEMDKATFVREYENMLSFIENYDDIVHSIGERNNAIVDFIQRSITKIKSMVFRESYSTFASMTGILLEQDDPVKSTNIDNNSKEDSKNNATSNNSQQEDKREEGQDADQSNKNHIKARENYNRLMYQINSARMSSVQGCYDTYVSIIHRAKLSAKKNKS